MSKPNPRHSEHMAHERANAETSVTTRSSAAGDLPSPQPASARDGAGPPLEPGMAQKYWIAIILWCISFGLMIFYEIIAVIWPG